MKPRTLLVAAAAIALIVTIPATVTAKDAGVRAAIDSANATFMDAFRKGDAAMIAEIYTRDARIFPPMGLAVQGREGIEEYWTANFDMGIASVFVETDEVHAFADVVCEIGRYSARGVAGDTIAGGTYMTVWKKENGRWKIHRDLGNLSLPNEQGRVR